MSSFIIPNYYSISNTSPTMLHIQAQSYAILGHSVLKKNYDSLFNAYIQFKLQINTEKSAWEDLQIPMIYNLNTSQMRTSLDDVQWENFSNNANNAKLYLELLNSLKTYLESVRWILGQNTGKNEFEKLELNIQVMRLLVDESNHEYTPTTTQPTEVSWYNFDGLSFIKQEEVAPTAESNDDGYHLSFY